MLQLNCMPKRKSPEYITLFKANLLQLTELGFDSHLSSSILKVFKNNYEAASEFLVNNSAVFNISNDTSTIKAETGTGFNQTIPNIPFRKDEKEFIDSIEPMCMMPFKGQKIDVHGFTDEDNVCVQKIIQGSKEPNPDINLIRNIYILCNRSVDESIKLLNDI